MKLSEAMRGRENNFNLMRAVAALLVILSHSYALVGRAFDPGVWLTGFGTASSIGVYTFFIFSGFLITKSWCDQRNIFVYILKRSARILPAYMLAVIGAAFILGPLVTTLPLGEYLDSPLTWSYLTNNLTFFSLQYPLPGVFADLKFPHAVNGSLWSLPVEAYLYCCVPMVATGGLLFRRWAGSALLVLTSILLAFQWHYFLKPANVSRIYFHLLVYITVICATFFALGACFYVYRDAIPFRRDLMIGATILYIGSWHTPQGMNCSFLCLPYIVFYFAFSPSRLGREFSRWGDPSYGMYVYAFPIQQLVCYSMRNIGPRTHFVVSALITIPIAYLSWHLLEKRVLNLVRRMLQRTKTQEPQELITPPKLRIAA